MKNNLLALLIILNSCMDNSVQSQPFTGSFEGQQPGLVSEVSLQTNGNAITGSFALNGRPGKVTAELNGNNFEGILYDIEMQKNYSFKGLVKADSLFMDIVFPELNNQVISLELKRTAEMNTVKNENAPAGNKNKALVGLWRYTETFTSGSGEFYSSLSTDYFMDFKADGIVYSWTGKSAGGSNDVSIEGYPSGTTKGGWYTEGKTLYLTDLTNGQKSSVLFYAEPNRLMLHNGGEEKKVMVRINN